MKDLASRLRKARERAGLRLSELDSKAKLTAGHSWLIEQRKRVDPQVSTVVALADALNVSVGWLATGEDACCPRVAFTAAARRAGSA